MKSFVNLLNSFQVIRVKDIDFNILKSITPPVINNEEQRQILDLFLSKEYLEDDKNGKLASFVVISSECLPLAFFSLRCGELFENASIIKMKYGYNAFVALQRMTNGEIQNKEDYDKALNIIKEALSQGLSIEDFEAFGKKKEAWAYDSIIDKDKEINKVLNAFPAIELKLFGVNEAAKEYWNTLPLSEDWRLGEAIFWVKVVEIIQQIQDYIGCQYLYLFAADKEAEGQLVQYYRVRLGFCSDTKMTANKPMFDWKCQFLFQDIESLFKRRDLFSSSFVK